MSTIPRSDIDKICLRCINNCGSSMQISLMNKYILMFIVHDMTIVYGYIRVILVISMHFMNMQF